jgi:lysophospholipase L1-like esterase
MSTPEYKIVVFGDSIAWGQGLAEHEKYHTIVANSISQRLSVEPKKKIFAHSGATINYDSLTEDDMRYLQNCGERVLHGEIPTSFPTITKQVADFPEEEAKTVDLVLLTGGINDVGVHNIMFNLSPLSQEEEIKKRTSKSCYEQYEGSSRSNK